jgi:tyrosine-protein kinase Etk/Wzc
MTQIQPHITTQEDSDLIRALNIFIRNYKIILVSVFIMLLIAFLFNRYAIPIYKVSSSVMINQETRPQGGSVNEYINSDIFGTNQSFQNELYVLQSIPVIEQTVKNLDLIVNYYQKEGLRNMDAYKNVPFRVLLLTNHVQPLNVSFLLSINDSKNFTLKAESKEAVFANLYTGESTHQQDNWVFEQRGKFGELIETADMAFIVQPDSINKSYIKDAFIYSFEFTDLYSMTIKLKNQLEFNVIDRDATVIEIGLNTKSTLKGKDIVNELMDVYSTQNLNSKNHIAEMTIEYIERQLGEISDSLSITEDNLQQFRSSRQLLDVTGQATGISAQYMDLQNQLAELVTRKRYYDYLAGYLTQNDNFSDMTVPSSMGIQDPLLNNLVSELITAQTQRSNLIKNKQAKNPLVQTLGIQIENARKTISQNIAAVQKTTDITIDEMNKRIRKVGAEISRMPKTQRQLGGIERNYRLNDAIYNYLLEKRAEAKISQASNVPDNIIIEPAQVSGFVSPNTRKNYLFAFVLGIMIPYLSLFLRSIINDKIEFQENIEHITEVPLLGKIPHNKRKTRNVVYEYPKSGIAEAYRALRTNLEYHFKDMTQKVIMVTSSIEGEGKSFNALNIAMIYAQLGRRTILVDFDLRKPTGYFTEQEISPVGLSSYFTDIVEPADIIQKSPHSKLDYIPSGPIPPNPVEMMALDSTKELLNWLKDHYDIVIIDTTPLAQVADAYMLMDEADIKVIIARYNYTPKKIFKLIMKDLKQKNISNICIVMNDNRVNQDQYGYGYGYNKKRS